MFPEGDYNKKILAFFEIIDFVPMAVAAGKGTESGWHGWVGRLLILPDVTEYLTCLQGCLGLPAAVGRRLEVGQVRAEDAVSSIYHLAKTSIKTSTRFLFDRLKLRIFYFYDMCRLQLYRAGGRGSVWDWWRARRRPRYPGSLWVTVQPVSPPSSAQPALRSMLPTQPEQVS